MASSITNEVFKDTVSCVIITNKIVIFSYSVLIMGIFIIQYSSFHTLNYYLSSRMQLVSRCYKNITTVTGKFSR